MFAKTLHIKGNFVIYRIIVMMVICVLNKLPMCRLFRIMNISRLLRSNQLTRSGDFLVTVKVKLFHIETIYNNVHHMYFATINMQGCLYSRLVIYLQFFLPK